MEKSISFRSHLIANILDLINTAGWNCARTAQLIAGIVSQLAAYTEEGVAIAPRVFLCNSIAQLVQQAGVGEYVPLSSEIPLESAGPKLLKAAAPLCLGSWRIYIERLKNGDVCKYGVFCGTSDPSSLTIDEVVLDEYVEGFPVVRISQSATNKVEVRTNKRDSIEFRFNDDNDVGEIKDREHLRLLSTVISGKSGPRREVFSGYVDRILSTAINDCHGTLIAVVSSASEELPEKLLDWVALNPPLHLYERFDSHFEEGKTAVSVSRLQAVSELVAGFINSDGITVFNNNGYVLGYRAFVHGDTSEKPVDGGARSRAYEVMKELIGTDLIAAFFRSQDGRTEYIQVKNEEWK